MYFPGFGIRRDRRIRLLLQKVRDQRLHFALSGSADLDHFGIDPFRLQLVQIRTDILFKHRDQFVGRTREENSPFPVFAKDQTGRRSVIVIYNNGSFGNHGLFPVVFCDLSSGLLKIRFNTESGMWVFHQFHAEHFCRHFFCQVVSGWPKAAAEYHDIRTGYRLTDHLFHPFFVVAHHALVVAGQPQHGALLRQVSGVGIHDVSKQDLCPYADKFYGHSTCLPLSVPARSLRCNRSGIPRSGSGTPRSARCRSRQRPLQGP